MKTNTKQSIQQLTEELVKLIKNFIPQPKMIKKRVEALVEQKYMKRDSNDKKIFIYLP